MDVPDFNLQRKYLLLAALGLCSLSQLFYIQWRDHKFRPEAEAGTMKTSSNTFSDFVRNGSDLQMPPPNSEEKVILLWTIWYTPDLSWEERFGDQFDYRKMGCSELRCKITSDKSELKQAHAVLFRSDAIVEEELPQRFPDQRWVWVEVEAPLVDRGKNALAIAKKIGFQQINWTMSYHTSSDIMAANGFLLPHHAPLPLRGNQLSYHKKTLNAYLRTMEANSTLEDTIGPEWREFVSRPKPVMWMSSNCHTHSKREEYVQELSKYVLVDTFGICGRIKCGGRYDAFKPECWHEKMQGKYMFALAFENSLCDHYLSEKPYNPMIYGIVPIVWGGEGYEEFLPPGSYINARHYHPRKLAEVIQELQNDPVAYGRYHIWRNYWTVKVGGSFCELCHRLHTDPVRGHHTDLEAWRDTVEQCVEAPKDMFKSDSWNQVIRD